jgi:LuxR family maltose regulon positive regulatory protein
MPSVRTKSMTSAKATAPRVVEHEAEALPFEIVESKIQAPVIRTGLVSRTALVNRLRANNTAAVVTVTAPGGYGKTTALSQWAVRDPRPFAWVTVDESDRDPLVLLRHVAAAVNVSDPLALRVLDALVEPGHSIWTSALPRLTAAVADAGPLVIVLDDAHLLRSPDSVEAVALLTRHLTEGSTLVLAGRIAPRLPIPALRAAGNLLELGADELALTPREGQLLLRAAGADVTVEAASLLVRECEGWPAALYLAALSLRDDAAKVQHGDKPIKLAGPSRNLGEYFRSEYLSRLPSRTLQFLRRTSVLEEMCGSLCDAVLDAKGSAHELETIERANLFVVPLDGQRSWYRYHRLFRDALRGELVTQEPKLVPVLHRRAADWYEAQGDLESALDHAHAAGDLRRAARILTTIALPMYHTGRVTTVERWLAKFDDPALLVRYPTVALQGSWIHAMRGRATKAEQWLERAELTLRNGRATAGQRAWLTVIRASLCNDGVYQMIADAERALGGSRDATVRPAALMVLGAGYMLLGQHARADAVFADAATEAERVGATDTQVVAIGERSLIASAQNNTSAAERLAQDAQELVKKGRLDGYGTTALALAASARAALRIGQWEDARAALDTVRDSVPTLGRGSLPWFAVQTRLELARAYLALRETRTVRSLLAEIHVLLQEGPHFGVLVDETESLEREVESLPDPAGASAGLTPAELRLLPFLSTHLSFREIGEHLYVSRNTIKTQAISVYRKLGVTSRSEAISCAARLGLVDVHHTGS